MPTTQPTLPGTDTPHRPTFAPDALADRTVLVTGAARGLGLGIAEACVRAGARVIVTDLDRDQVEAAAAELGPDVTGLAHDVTDEASWAAVVDQVRTSHGALHGLVNNAGIFEQRSFADSDLATFRRSIDVNLVGPFLGTKAFLELHDGRGGSIVNVASVRGLVSGAGLASYSGSKFGVRGLTKAAAVELGPLGIRANTICPGTIASPMSSDASATWDWDAYLARIPLGVAGAPVHIGEAACWLLSDASAYVSGIDVPVDGGVLATGNTPQPRTGAGS